MMEIRQGIAVSPGVAIGPALVLDSEGFPNTAIIASNDLDEYIISSLKDQGARIGIWGVGTRLVTGYDQPALGGVYKLSALRQPGGDWQPKLKLSEQSAKISTPGILQVRRFFSSDGFIADAIYDIQNNLPGDVTIVDPLDFTRRKRIPEGTQYDDLLVPIYREGRLVYTEPALQKIRSHAAKQLDQLHAGVRRFVHPHIYPVGLERNLHDLKTQLILESRKRRM